MDITWWLILLALIPIFLVQNVIHEISHAIPVWIRGGTLTLLKPYPHYHEGKFYFARMSFKREKTWDDFELGWISLAPAVHNIFLFGFLAPFTLDNPHLNTIFLMLWIAQAIDFTNNIKNLLRGSDSDLPRVEGFWDVSLKGLGIIAAVIMWMAIVVKLVVLN